MTKVVELAPPMPDGHRLLLDGIDWHSYERCLDAFGEQRLFLTYDRGRLEIMAPLYDHEWWKRRIGFLLPVLGSELKLDVQGGGQVTLRRQDLLRGLEADECFFVRSAARVLGPRRLDLSTDPAPDLAVEVEMTRSALDRMGIYAALGVPEVWRHDGKRLRAYRLREDGEYEESNQSDVLPMLPLDEFDQFMHRTQGLSEAGVLVPFQEWVRQNVLPRSQSPGGGA